ncbi:MAG: sigma-70 family RNA polymerase sigma factor [Planctomycetota bacterium]|nr:MAG: sigma-70 family RNA polymerase sigma factor [Planctomycetota bacterium]REK28035.1 MAG: sigma-70 family RNA polymerase sigma factor [Planctomycetota bacterium]REK37562.1 MAG: sigma-70 family RNA polymerase sigma factor [Planctomycetota bacterium]
MSESFSSDSTSPTLLERAKRNDDGAWDKVSQLYAPRIYAWARRAGLQEEDAKDVGQEVFQLLAVKLSDFDRRRTGSFRNWLFQSTQLLLKEHFRKKAKHPELMGEKAELLPAVDIEGLDDPSTIENDDTERAFMHRLMNLVRDDFEERTWNIFWRSTVEGDDTADLAAEYGMTGKAVRQAKYRVLQRLRREVEELS